MWPFCKFKNKYIEKPFFGKIIEEKHWHGKGVIDGMGANVKTLVHQTMRSNGKMHTF